VWAEMPAAPRVGDTVHLTDEGIPAMHVTHVSWVQMRPTSREADWHVECSVS
jgi:hypothetical protein